MWIEEFNDGLAKLFIIIVIIFALGDIFVTKKLLINKENSDTNNSKVSIFIDNETGVNYFITNDFFSNKTGIVPRYNDDGTFYVTVKK